jgi:hypothetical protein
MFPSNIHLPSHPVHTSLIYTLFHYCISLATVFSCCGISGGRMETGYTDILFSLTKYVNFPIKLHTILSVYECVLKIFRAGYVKIKNLTNYRAINCQHPPSYVQPGTLNQHALCSHHLTVHRATATSVYMAVAIGNILFSSRIFCQMAVAIILTNRIVTGDNYVQTL